MEHRPWHAQYPPGVPVEIDPDSHASVADLILSSCRRNGSRVALTNMSTDLSFAALDARSREFAAWLTVDAGLQRGDRVAVMLPNLLQSPIAILGTLRAGLVVVNVNPLYTPRELENQLKDSGARVIVVLENFAATLAKALPATPIERVVIAAAGDCLSPVRRWLTNFVVRRAKKLVPPYQISRATQFREVLRRGRRLAYTDPKLAGTDLAFLQYTGGTSGTPKGAMLTHRNLVANVLQTTAIVRPFIDSARDSAVTALPLYHIYALTVNLFTFIELGARNLLITNPRDMPAFLRELARYRPAFITGVNTLFNGLMQSKGFADVDFSGLKVAMGGGAAVQEDVARRWQEKTGVAIGQGYGLTEASPVVSVNRLDSKTFNGSVGTPIPSTDVRILDDAGRAVPADTPGELCVKGPQVMLGYWQRPDETAKSFTADGWLRTGDVARMDATGVLFIEDRKKDLILVSGFNVYPSEVENVVTMHPGVHEAAVIGVPDADSGEAVKLFVVRKDPALDEAAIRAFCRERLTGYKRPRQIVFVESLPKSNVGKVLRRELR